MPTNDSSADTYQIAAEGRIRVGIPGNEWLTITARMARMY